MPTAFVAQNNIEIASHKGMLLVPPSAQVGKEA